MDFFALLGEAQQGEEVRFQYSPQFVARLLPAESLLQFDGRLSIVFEWPAFLTDHQHGCLPAHMIHRLPATFLDQPAGSTVRHRGQCAGEGDTLTLQAAGTLQFGTGSS